MYTYNGQIHVSFKFKVSYIVFSVAMENTCTSIDTIQLEGNLIIGNETLKRVHLYYLNLSWWQMQIRIFF